MIAMILRLHQEGYTPTQIGMLVGCGRELVEEVLEELGLLVKA